MGFLYSRNLFMRIRLIMSPMLLGLAVLPLNAQFLSPDETVKTISPAESPAPPTAPVTVQPEAAPVVPQVNQNFPDQSGDGFFADFAAYGREKNIILTWHLVRGRTMDKRIQIYRFTEQPRVIHDISRGTLIAKLSGDINLYEDLPPARGTYYYAVFVESTRGLEPSSFNPARNMVGPVAYQSATPAKEIRETPQPAPAYARPDFSSHEIDAEDREVDDEAIDKSSRRGINGVIRRTFLKGDYAEAVRALKPFLRNTSPQVRAKAMFYTGLARFRLEQYERAMKYFEHPLTRKYYRRNAEFWISRTSENLR